MKNNKVVLVLMMILAVFTLSACSNAPRCNDKDVKKAVINRLLINTFENHRTNPVKMADLINLRLEDVRVIQEDPKTKQCMCSATIKYVAYKQPYRDKYEVFSAQINGPFNDEALAKLKKEDRSEQIEYKVQKAADTGNLWLWTSTSWIGTSIILYFSESDQVVHYK